MDELAAQEKQKYDTLWNTFPEYREQSPADYLIPVFLSYFEKEIQPKDTLLDFGCGPGRSARFALEAEMAVHLVDLSEHCLDPEIFLLHLKKVIEFTQGCLWDLPLHLNPAKWISCFDVLEHIPETQVGRCLKEMSSRMTEGGLFSICLAEDQFGKVTGKKLHLTIKPAHWWREQVSRYFQIEKEFLTDEKTLVLALRKKRSKDVGNRI